MFLETICIWNGEPRYLSWHQQRVDASLKSLITKAITGVRQDRPHLSLLQVFDTNERPGTGKHKCRIIYDEGGYHVEISPYSSVEVSAIQLIDLPPGYDYRYKYEDRSVIMDLLAGKGDADEILMLRDGWITDTSIANIAFLKDQRWYTPSIPLLAGTTWKRLVQSGTILPRPIHWKEINQFESVRIFNAMNDWTETPVLPVSMIKNRNE